MVTYKIRELDLDMIAPRTKDITNFEGGGSKIVVIGKPNTGKTFLITSILYAKKHIIPVGLVMSGTEDSNEHYGKIFPKSFVFHSLDEEKLKIMIKRQKMARKYIENPWAAVLLDDCMDDPKIFNKPLFHSLFKCSRHWCLLFIVSLQYCMDVRPVIRTNVDGVFILRESILKNRESLWKNYASIIPDFTDFCNIMDQLTDDHTALYIHNRTDSNVVEDNIFYYKAKPTPDGFKFGCPEFWDFHNQRYDPEREEKF